MRTKLALGCGFVSLWVGAALAQVQEVNGLGQFSPQAVQLGVRGAAADDLRAIFSLWGVRIEATGGGLPSLAYITIENINILPPAVPVANNRPAGGSSAGLPLIVNFSWPVRRVAFALANGSDETTVTATLSAFDASGKLLGTVSRTGLQKGPVNGPFGIETSSPEGISKAVIDYGDWPGAEQFSAVIFEYVTRPRFRRVAAQVGVGSLADGRG